jgi:hypothetical protein
MRLQQDTTILSPDFRVHVKESDMKSRTEHFDRRSVVSGTLHGAPMRGRGPLICLTCFCGMRRVVLMERDVW